MMNCCVYKVRKLFAQYQLFQTLHVAVKRNDKYNQLNNEDISFFSNILSEVNTICDEYSLVQYNKDWMGKYNGNSQVVLKPKTTEEVSKVLAYCSSRRLAVVPQGGNTGLVGGSVPVFDEVVLSLTAMNKIRSFDEVGGTLISDAGCILQTLDEFVSSKGFIMPLDLGAKGSCQIGGNVSTNAGGLRLVRYGSLRGTVLGLEVVLADGTILDLLRTLRKDNTGYDLKQLFIGAEGSLGVVTGVAIQCAPRPKSIQLSFLAVPDYQAVQGVLAAARSYLAEVLSAVEFLDAESLAMVNSHGVPSPLPGTRAPFYILVETHGSNEAHDTEKMNTFIEHVMEAGLAADGVLSQSSSQSTAIWRVREGITESLTRRGAVYKYDLSMPIPLMYSLVEEMRTRLSGWAGVKVVGYGHVGDGNLHLNISTSGGYDPELESLIEPFVYEWTTRVRGSVSAEHGLGRMKSECIEYSKPAEAVGYMARLKALFDPQGILNPYKVLPEKAVMEAYKGE